MHARAGQGQAAQYERHGSLPPLPQRHRSRRAPRSTRARQAHRGLDSVDGEADCGCRAVAVCTMQQPVKCVVSQITRRARADLLLVGRRSRMQIVDSVNEAAKLVTAADVKSYWQHALKARVWASRVDGSHTLTLSGAHAQWRVGASSWCRCTWVCAVLGGCRRGVAGCCVLCFLFWCMCAAPYSVHAL